MINREDIIHMAREAGSIDSEDVIEIVYCAFAAASAAKERKAVQADREADKIIIEYHEATIKRLESGILAEREACAKVCEDASGTGKIISCMCAAKAIRGRSNT